jgi:pyruvate dehydrogenase E1 component
MIPFFIYYAMFGFQRIGDLIWAAGDIRARGFMLGATAGRTTLNGEGLQHQDGHSHLAAATIPTLYAYDPAFAYEIAVIVWDGLKRMYGQGEEVFYYITLYNENLPMPAMPAGVEEGILQGLYRFKKGKGSGKKAHLLASGPLVWEALRAQEILRERYGVSVDVWSATNYKRLRAGALEAERWNRLHPGEQPRVPYVTECLGDAEGAIVAASDYVKVLPGAIDRWLPRRLVSLGTDGFGRSENRATLRDFFEVDARFITLAALDELARAGALDAAVVKKAVKDLGINPEKPNPAHT